MTSLLEGAITHLRVTNATSPQPRLRAYPWVPPSDMLKYKDDPTVTGFMIRCSEANQHLSYDEKQRFLLALSIAPHYFTNKVCRALDALEDDVRSAEWLRKYVAASVDLLFGSDDQSSELSREDVEELEKADALALKMECPDAAGESTITPSSLRTRSDSHSTGNENETITHLCVGSPAGSIDQETIDFWS